MRRAIGFFSRVALFSSSVCRSSSRRMKRKYVICSMTSSGFEMPPDQNAFQIWSTWFLMVPVIMARRATFYLQASRQVANVSA